MNNPTKIVNLTSKINPKGKVYRQSYSGNTLKFLLEQKLGVNLDSCYVKYVDGKGVIDFNALIAMAFDLGISREDFKVILDKSIKKQFADNFIWRFLKRNFGIDLVIPFVTGYWSKSALRGNVVTNVGHKLYADLLGGLNSATPLTAMAYGTGAVAAAATDTALGAEIARGAATISSQTTSVTGDTARFVKTFTAPGVQAVAEEGLLDNNTSGGKLGMRQTFSVINQVTNDTVQFTHGVQS